MCSYNCLVHYKRQQNEDAESCWPILLSAGCATHQPSPLSEDAHDSRPLLHKNGQFYLSLCAARSRENRVFLSQMGLYIAYRCFIKDEAAFEDGAGYMNLDGLPKEHTLHRLVLTIAGYMKT